MQKDSGLGSSGQVLTGLALVIDGRNTFGETGEVKMPDWEFLVVNEESTGIVKSPKVTVPTQSTSRRYCTYRSRKRFSS